MLEDHCRKTKYGWFVVGLFVGDCCYRTRALYGGRTPQDGRRFTVIADEKLTAFLELERVTCESNYPDHHAEDVLLHYFNQMRAAQIISLSICRDERR